MPSPWLLMYAAPFAFKAVYPVDIGKFFRWRFSSDKPFATKTVRRGAFEQTLLAKLGAPDWFGGGVSCAVFASC